MVAVMLAQHTRCSLPLTAPGMIHGLFVKMQGGLPGSLVSRPCQRAVVAKANDGEGKGRVDWDREWSRYVSGRHSNKTFCEFAQLHKLAGTLVCLPWHLARAHPQLARLVHRL